MAKSGIKVLEVERGSPAEAIGLVPGDQILAAKNHPIQDEVALKFYLAEGLVDLQVRRSNGIEEALNVDLSDGSDLGVQLEEFRTQTCNNACLFCFVDQLPAGVRPSLKVKDDDYRLSFLHGNYITLTNVRDRELNRIIEQRLSPLYVSVHSTDPALRARILGREKADDLNSKIKKLITGRIRLHTQIVLIPEFNDGKHLTKTVFDLYGLYPGVHSVAIVPLGLSDHGAAKDRFRPVTPAYCRRIIKQVTRWQDQFRAQIGRTFAYLADELYLRGGVDLPERDRYDDFAQIEDGVGMVRTFLDEFEMELNRLRRSRLALRGTLATGPLFFPFLLRCAERFNAESGSHLQVCRVQNRFLGRRITVGGLLAGKDFIKALNGQNTGDFIIIPDEAVSRVNETLIDDLSLKDLSDHFAKPVYPSGRTMRDFFQLLLKISLRR